MAAIVLELLEKRITGLIAVAIAFVLHQASSESHPAVYALEPDFDTDSSEFRITMAVATGMPLVDGNSVRLYNNGDEFYPAMLEAIESANLSITMEQYIFWDGLVGRRFAEAFAEKARAGITRQAACRCDWVGDTPGFVRFIGTRCVAQINEITASP